MRHSIKPIQCLATVQAVLVIGVSSATAQVQVNSRAVEITFTGRVHSQFYTTSVDGERSAEFQIRRARLTAAVKINDFVDGRIQPDYGRGKISLKDAFLRLSFDPAFRVSFGQLKRAFDIFELYSSTQILVIERTGDIAGVDACAGPGGVCSWSRLTQKLAFAERDVGVSVAGRANERVGYNLTVTNGTGENTADENAAKSYSGRVTFQATSGVRLGVNAAAHDYLNATTASTEYAYAYGGDVEIGAYGDQVHIQAGILTAQNWMNLDAAGDPSTLVTAQGIFSYRMTLEGNDRFSAVEPLARVSVGDPDTSAGGSGGLLVTPGITLHLSGRNMLVANLDLWSPSAGGTEWSLKMQSFLHF